MSFRILPPDISSRSLFQSFLYSVQSVAKEDDVIILFHILDAFKLPATALFEWGRGEVAELVYRLTLIGWEPIRAIITSSVAEMEA